MEKRMTNTTIRDIVDMLWSKRWSIIKFCAIVFIGAAIISLFLPNKFKATTVFYAASDDLSRPEVMFGVSKERSYYYGGNNERDRILSVSKSGMLIEKLLEKHDLFAHYDIKPDEELSRLKLSKKFRKNFEVIKNELDALELSFIDEDREFAALIANDARNILNQQVSNIIKSSQDNFITSLDQKITESKDKIALVSDSIQQIRKEFGFYDSQNQIAQITELLVNSKNKLESERARLDSYKKMRNVRRDTINNIEARITGLRNQIQSIENPDSMSAAGLDVESLTTILPILQMYEGRYYTLRGEVGRDEVNLSMLHLAKNASTPAIHVIEPAAVPLLKFKPRRSILVLGVTLAAFLFYVLGLILIEGYKRMDVSS